MNSSAQRNLYTPMEHHNSNRPADGGSFTVCVDTPSAPFRSPWLDRYSIRSLTQFLLLTFAMFACVSRTCWTANGSCPATPVPEQTNLDTPFSDGLVVYFDASQINATKNSSENSKPKSDNGQVAGKPIQQWSSLASGGLVAVAPESSKQPKLLPVGDGWVVRFDGEDDVLRVSDTQLELTEATIFVVAAPHSNAGEFRGLFAANAANQRDYQSGFTIDLGPGPTSTFDQLNVEGRGFGGAASLRKASSKFGELKILEVNIDPKAGQVNLKVDGKSEGTREFKQQSISLKQLTLGARFYTNGPGEQIVRGTFQGDLAAVLVFNKMLSDQDAILVRKFLQQKYLSLNEPLKATLPKQMVEGVPLVKVENPPLIQMLLPGFEVRELPLSLTNINNVRYRRDGKLVTLGYNGDIHLLSDTDGDGVEDSAKLFWKNSGSIRGPIGMVLTPPNYPHGQGVILPSKGKVSMIVDRDGDDQGDEELIVAQGWKEIAQNVDAVGLAMDASGNLYFGLGTANYANAYLIDQNGQAAYDINSDRGTVQKVSADWSKRETVCTGIRFPIAFEFNAQGDLFCTEQEGATWLPNGNPLDELLHIPLDGRAPKANPIGKRHFGFPPRHPVHNPSVIDEPSVFDYGPQHQSTCGMVFNQSVNGGPVFGPPSWQGDAIVCGESRGKIWRTKLLKSNAGYIAESQLIACLQMLTVDACVSPRGDLIVACHSGPPDWGTGPTGIGKLFRVHMSQAATPRPIAAWIAGPSEFQIAFDQPLDVAKIRGLASRAVVQFGLHVRAGDRFENLVPPYAVVRQQQMQPRFNLPVHSVALSPDGRTLTLNTDQITQNVHHSITLQIGEDQLDIDARANGVQASWTAKGADRPTWQGYLPHLDLTVSQQLLEHSAFHAALWPLLQQAGKLKLEAKVDARSMLRPAVQAGAKIDYAWPDEQVALHFQAANLNLVDKSAKLPMEGVNRQTKVQLDNSSDWIDLSIEITTQSAEPAKLSVAFSTAEDETQRPLSLNRFLQPWAPTLQNPDKTKSTNSIESIPELAGGSWGQGRRLFHDDRTLCAKCHAIGGEGAKIGPDLGNLVHRDYASVLRDILEPSRMINPDYLSQSVLTKDGRALSGVISSEGDQIIVADAKGNLERVARGEIEQMKSLTTSVMPQELLARLSDPERRDLLTYLLTPAPTMPLDSPLPAPPIRSRAEVATALQGSQPLPSPLKKLNIVLIDGVKDHGPGEHDYPAWQRAWAELIRSAPEVQVSTVREFPSDEQMASADILIFFQKGSFSFQRSVQMDKFLQRGGGAVFIHWAVNGEDRVQEFAKRIGLASWGGRIKYRHGPLSLDVVNKQHPIMRNIGHLDLYDESYWKLTGDLQDVTVLATSTEDGEVTPQVWIRDHNPGRVFVSIPGHYNWTFDDPLFRILLLRGIAWTANEPLDRFNELVTPGARMTR